MRHSAGSVGAILLGVFCAAPLHAADDPNCKSSCTVARALARALHEDGRERSGLRAGDGYWLLSYRVQLSKRFALQSNVQFALDPGMDTAVDSKWAIGVRFEIGTR
jgi:hypothetical protein